MRSQAEDCLLQIAGLTAQGANVADIQTAALRLQRQLVLDLGGTVLQLRMAAAEGMELADKIFSPVAGYDGLQEEQAKAFREYKKEQEKESKAKAQQAARGGGGFRGAGGYRGRGYYNYQPYTVPQQYGQQPLAVMQQAQAPPGYAGQQQVWPAAQQQTSAPVYGYQAPPPSIGTRTDLWAAEAAVSRGIGRSALWPSVMAVVCSGTTIRTTDAFLGRGRPTKLSRRACRLGNRASSWR